MNYVVQGIQFVFHLTSFGILNRPYFRGYPKYMRNMTECSQSESGRLIRHSLNWFFNFELFSVSYDGVYFKSDNDHFPGSIQNMFR